jgi:L-alanine-DL-glutamate epimerase-like enolase superfamily enzyme
MKLSWESYELELKHTFTVASYSRKTTPGVQVRIEYDGFTGHGEASMPPYLGHTVESVCSFLQKVDLGQFADPFQLEEIMAYVDSLSEGDAPAKAAVDIALHDLFGQLLGQPLFRIWGLDAAKAPSTTFTIGIDTPEVVREKTLECAGKFNILKVKVGLDNDEEMIKTIRSVTDLPLAVDANQGWKDRQKALDEIFWLAEQGVVMVEQPMPKERLDDIAWITEHSPVPIFADESIQRLRDIPAIKGAFSGVNIKLMKCTGLLEARKMLTYARAEGMKVMLGCMTETSCACTAAAHLSPGVDFADLDGNLLISNDLFEGMTIRDGRMILPDRPGLGLKKR